MQKHKIWRYALIALGFVVTSSAWASETWHVTSGANGEELSTWLVSRSADGGVKGGRAEVRVPGESGVDVPIFADPGVITIYRFREGSAFCWFAIEKISDDAASGTETCDRIEGVVPWSATIDAQK